MASSCGADESDLEFLGDAKAKEPDLARYDGCTKYPKHRDFISPADLTVEHLPRGFREPYVLRNIRFLCDRTVRLFVPYTSSSRPAHFPQDPKRKGSGILINDFTMLSGSQRCPLRECKYLSPHEVSPTLYIKTAAHVVCDDSEAEHTVVEFFYDSDDKSSVIEANGLEVVYANIEEDFCILSCVTHHTEICHKLKTNTKEIIEQLCDAFDDLDDSDDFPDLDDSDDSTDMEFRNKAAKPVGIIISHPHGTSKKITFGTIRDIIGPCSAPGENDGLNQWISDVIGGISLVCLQNQCYNYKRFLYTIPTCPGSSGAPVIVFQMVDKACWAWMSVHSRRSEAPLNQSGAGIGVRLDKGTMNDLISTFRGALSADLKLIKDKRQDIQNLCTEENSEESKTLQNVDESAKGSLKEPSK